MSRIRRSLTIDSSLGIPVNFTLQATIPAFMLSKCAAALPRPPWEPILYYSTMCLMGFLLFGVMVASYIEADRHFTADIIKRRVRSSLTFDKTKVFDLNQIASSVKADVNTSTATSSHNGKPANPQKSSETEVNGHVHPSRKKSESTLSSIFILRLIKNLFSRWNIHRDRNSNTSALSSRRSPDRQSSSEKETSKTSTTTTTPHNTKQHTMTDTIKSGMTAEGTLVSDNKINPYAVSKPFKKKMTKQQQQQQQQQQRQQTDLNCDVSPVAANEKKQGNKSNSTLTTNNNNTIQRKLSSDNSEPKEKASTSSSASHRRSTGVDHPDNDATSNATENNATKPESKCSKLSYLR